MQRITHSWKNGAIPRQRLKKVGAPTCIRSVGQHSRIASYVERLIALHLHERGAQANLTLSFCEQLKFRRRSFFHSVSSTWLISFSLSVAYRTRSVVFKSEKPEAVHMSRGSISSWQDYGRRSCKWLKIAFRRLIQFPRRYFPSIIYVKRVCFLLNCLTI